ncbi:MAG: ABC transporter ATP-binding protein [Acidimicrobiia bacterium]|nr:ABC transporter ATP-binding protein [Acidimicrobiia bacterium]
MKLEVDTAIPTAASADIEGVIELRDVERTYRSGRIDYRALRGVDLDVDEGEMVAIAGPSGSGKSTLLNIMTGIDRPSVGSATVGGRRLDEMTEDELALWRGQHVGIVFQFFQLLPTLTALENTMLPMDFARRGSVSDREIAARTRLELVGLGDRVDHFPGELSGGEQQRVAIARALANDPLLLVADEPTGNLDTETASAMLDVLESVNRAGTTVVYVTHDPVLSVRARRIVTLRDGIIVDDGR